MSMCARSMSTMSKLSIIIPVYYNEDTLELLYADLKEKVLDKIGEYEIVMIDDGSEDCSWSIMMSIAKKDLNVKLIKLSRNFGSHVAILAGLEKCTGDCAVIKAADLQEDSELLLEMYESWKKGNNVVLAARKDREEGKTQKFFATLYYKMVRKFISAKMPEGGFDIFLIDRKVIDVLKLLDEKNSAITLQVLWSGFQTDVIYYVRRERKVGKSRWTIAKKIKLVIDSLLGFSYLPIRFMTAVGSVCFFGSLVWSVVLFIQKLVIGIPIQGWTTLMIMLLLTSGLIMLMLGILGEYIWRCLDASRKRPPYIIERELHIEDERENKYF